MSTVTVQNGSVTPISGANPYSRASPYYNTYTIDPSNTLLLHCIAIPPAALRLASYYSYRPVLDRNGRHSTRLLTNTYRDTDLALV
jgi:hypothetical protein